MGYQIIMFALLYTAGFCLMRQVMGAPTLAMSRSLRGSIAVKERLSQRLYNIAVRPFIRPVSKLVRIEKQKEALLRANLKRAGFDMTPREYYARAIVAAALTLPLTALLIIIGLPVLTPATLMLTVLVYIQNINATKDTLKKKREAIENGLPSFIRSIVYKLGGGDGVVKADLIKIFEDYHIVIKETGRNNIFEYDIGVLIMEMKSIDIETALRNFDNRIRMTHVTYLVDALIGIVRGEDQKLRLETLAGDMSKLASENLKRELNKRPRRVKMAIVPLVIITVAVLFYVLVMHLISAMGVLF